MNGPVREDPAMSDLLHEIRHALRVHLQRPWMTLAAVVTLGLGIGANTAIFSIVNAVLLKPLPFPDLDRIVKVMPDYGDGAQPNVSPMQSVYWQERTPFFEDYAILTWQPFSLSLTGFGEAERLQGCRVQRSFFSVFGIPPFFGRVFSPAEDLAGGPSAVVLSHSLWQRRFGGDRQILGRQLTLNGHNHEVIGVMPAIFRYPAAADLWLPLQLDPNTRERGNYLTVAAKLGAGTTLDGARRDLAAANAEWVRDHALPGRQESATIQPLTTHLFGGARQPLILLGGCATLVLLIACVNVAHLELVRAGDRRLELATRLALGARTSQMVRQLLLESLLLALAGVALGLLICRWTYSAVLSVVSQSVPVYHDVEIDVTVLTFAVGLAVLVGIVTGLLPVRAGLRISLADAMKGGSVQSLSGGSRRRRLLLIAGQVTLTTIALVCAMLLMRSYFVLSQRHPGIRPDRVMAMQVALSPGDYGTGEAWERFSRRLLGDLALVPGVEHVAAMTNLPQEGGPWAAYRVAGRPPDDNGSGAAQCIGVSPSYFETLGIPLTRGRGFTEHDRRDGAAVVVINETMAARLWPDGDSLGERITVLLARDESEEPRLREVVGVAGDVLENGLQEVAPALFYVPMEQFPDSWAEYVTKVRSLGLAVRTRGSASIVEPVRERIRRFDADLPIHDVQPLETWLSARLQGREALMNLAGLLGILAAALTAVGIYGVLAFLVLQQTREIGLRQALGADRWMILRWILSQGMSANWIGLGAGLAAAALATRWIGGFVVVESVDPVAYGLTAILVSVVGLAAVAIPAYRAVQVQPSDALRTE